MSPRPAAPSRAFLDGPAAARRPVARGKEIRAALPPPVASRSAVAALACAIAMLCPLRATAGNEPAAPCAPGTPTIRVSVRNVEDSVGLVTVDLYGDADPAGFLRHQIARSRVPAVAGTTTACLALPAPGRYAVAAYHDRNADLHLDKNLLGIPVEPAGVSNDPAYFLRAPTFEEAAFVAGPDGADVVVTLRDVLSLPGR